MSMTWEVTLRWVCLCKQIASCHTPTDYYYVSLLTQGVERPEGLGVSSIRTARDLCEGMCITIEPGCYFIDHVSRCINSPSANLNC